METLSDCFSISLFYKEIYVLNANVRVEELIRSTLLINARKLLKSEYRLVDQHALVFRLKTDISTTSSTKAIINVYKIVSKLLTMLNEAGWIWLTSTCVSQNKLPSTLYFKKKVDLTETELQQQQQLICVSPVSNNQLMFVGHCSLQNDSYLKMIEHSYSKGIEKVKIYEKDYVLLVTLKGHPWGTKFVENEDVLLGKRLLLHVFQHMQVNCGYNYYANVSFDGKLNSLFFEKSKKLTIKEDCGEFFLMSFVDPPESIDPSLTIDELQLVEAPDHVTDTVRSCLMKRWSGYDGNVHKNSQHNVVTLTLSGHPWQAPKWSGARAQGAIGQLIASVQTLGYQLVAPLGSSVCERSMNSLIFRKVIQPNTVPVCTIAFNKRNAVYVLDAPTAVEDTIFRVVNEFWTPRLKHWERGPGNKDVLLKLFAEPFDQYANTATYLQVRYLIAAMIVELEKIGWTIVCSSHMTASHNYWPRKSVSLIDYKTPKYDMHSHTWFLMKLPS